MIVIISVIIPVYNVELFLDRCIKSVLNQTYRDFEIILVDDESTDNSLSICKNYTLLYNNIKIIQIKHSGVSCARNIGLENANGEFISFIDSDDYIHPRMFEMLFNNLIEYNADMSICTYKCTESLSDEIINSDTSDTVLYTGKELCKMMYCKKSVNYILVTNKLYRRYLFNEYRFSKGINHEDEDLIYHLYYISNSIVMSSSIMYYYYKNMNSITTLSKNIIPNKSMLIDVISKRLDFYISNKEKELSSLTYKKLMTDCITYLSIIYYYKDMPMYFYDEQKKRCLKIYKSYRKRINLPFLRKCYYKLFFILDIPIIRIRTLKHKL